MRKTQLYLTVFTLFLFAGTLCYGQEKVDRVTVPFSNPSKPGLVKAHTYNGGITVKGYNGKEVIIEARLRGKILTEKKKISEKAKGMRLIQTRTTGLSVVEEDNVMSINVESQKKTVDLTIQVPFSTSLKLHSYKNGDITVDKVNGEIEVEHYKGELKFTDVSGAVVAHAYSGNITVTFVKVHPEKPMSFSNWKGDIDVTFPANIKASLKMKSDRGEIYSDFDLKIMPTPQEALKGTRKKDGKFRLSIGQFIYGTINGGGPEYHFKTYSGDILIRKAK